MHGLLNMSTGEPVLPGAAMPASFVNVSWLFYVYEVEEGSSRFVSRWRVDYPPSFRNEIVFGRWLLEPIASVMDFKMLKGVRQRAESAR
jgi:hypothetical protein